MIDIRTGLGYDTHIFGDGDQIMLGGIAIPHSRGVIAHSDGDVVLHALTDALLGAVGKGDIGDHFPPSDHQWKNAESYIFLSAARDIVNNLGYTIANVDMTVIAELPKVGPHRSEITQRIAQILQIEVDRVSIKATTNEKMGFLGRGEGIAAMAICTLIKDE